MSMAEMLLPEFEQEVATTRRVLERAPDDQLGWKPHPKSWTMGQLASHVANILRWVDATMNTTGLDMASVPPDQMNQVAGSRAELLKWFDANVAAARPALNKSDAEYTVPWTLRNGDAVFFTLPRAACLRTFCLNHAVHHRGQLSVYLRLADIPVPSIYGPSADEQQ